MADNKEIGAIGEGIAAHYLQSIGQAIIARNYAKKWGEVDIISKTTDSETVIHFVEVKTVSHETMTHLERSVTRETWHPEDLVHSHKLRQISRMVETWIAETGWKGNVQVDVAAVRMVPREKYATVNLIENVYEE